MAFGTPFPSPTKGTKGRTPLTIFQAAKQQVTVPVFAIGGITIANAQQVLDAGADGLSVVSGVFTDYREAGAWYASIEPSAPCAWLAFKTALGLEARHQLEPAFEQGFYDAGGQRR